MRPGLAVRRGGWCVLAIWALRAGVAAVSGAVVRAAAEAEMGPYLRGDLGVWPALLELLSEGRAVVGATGPLLMLCAALGLIAGIVTTGGVLAHLRRPEGLGGFVERALRWAPAMLMSAVWMSLLRLVLLGLGLVLLAAISAPSLANAGLVLGVFALTTPVYDHARAMIVGEVPVGRYGPRPTWVALRNVVRQPAAALLSAIAFVGMVASGAGASAVALAWPHGSATAWCVRGLGLLAATLYVLRLSLFVVDDEARDA